MRTQTGEGMLIYSTWRENKRLVEKHCLALNTNTSTHTYMHIHYTHTSTGRALAFAIIFSPYSEIAETEIRSRLTSPSTKGHNEAPAVSVKSYILLSTVEKKCSNFSIMFFSEIMRLDASIWVNLQWRFLSALYVLLSVFCNATQNFYIVGENERTKI